MSMVLVQNPAYHLFADTRPLFGVANASDTLSNLAFVAVGLLGLAWLRGPRPGCLTEEEKLSWRIMFVAILLTGLGSAWYHLAPDDARLVWDRLPMSLGFAALLAATVSERTGLRWGLRLLVPLLLLAAGSVGWWSFTGNLAPYALMQFGSLGAVLAIVIGFRSRYSHGRYMLGGLAAYAGAKMTERLDAWIFSLGGFVSGHTLKHLLAAAGVLLLLRMLQLRRPQ